MIDDGHGSAEMPSLTGTIIGSYRMLEPLGEGGMSIVYLAERIDGHYDERVAVKLLRHPGPNKGLARRFHMERQILAKLDHPHIARILDGGVSDDGWPYLIMEYVEGQSLIDHAHQSTLSQKLSLFRDVCSAVQHAHRHLIVHRDLKPSNILVTPEGTVKLLDFGIAKLIDDQHFQTDVTLPFTGTGLRLMTPEYAAPEQVRGQDITTSTDVYALGILLYELLSGRRPYRLADSTPTQIEELVCVQDPPPPESPDSDLDTICLKALRKEPDRCYAGAGDPRAAGTDTLHVRDLLARGVERADKLSSQPDLQADMLLLIGRAYTRIGQFSKAEEILHTGLALQQSGPQPNEAAVASTLGELAGLHLKTGEFRDARDLQAVVLNRQRQVLGSDHFDVATSLNNLAVINRRLGEIALAEELYCESLALKRRIHDGPHPDIARSLDNLGVAVGMQGRYDEALQAATEAIRLGDDLLSATHPDRALALGAQAQALLGAGRYEEAAGSQSESRRLIDLKYGDRHPAVATAALRMSRILYAQGKLEEAAVECSLAVDLSRTLLGGNHPRTAEALHQWGKLRIAHKDTVQAIAALEEALAIRMLKFGVDSVAAVESRGLLETLNH